MHHHPAQFVLGGNAKYLGVLPHAVVADEDVAGDSRAGLQVEGDHVGVLVVAQVALVVRQQALVADQHEGDLTDGMPMVGGYGMDPLPQAHPFTEGVGHVDGLEGDGAALGHYSAAGARLNEMATVAPLSENSTASESARIRNTP